MLSYSSKQFSEEKKIFFYPYLDNGHPYSLLHSTVRYFEAKNWPTLVETKNRPTLVEVLLSMSPPTPPVQYIA